MSLTVSPILRRAGLPRRRGRHGPRGGLTPAAPAGTRAGWRGAFFVPLATAGWRRVPIAVATSASGWAEAAFLGADRAFWPSTVITLREEGVAASKKAVAAGLKDVAPPQQAAAGRRKDAAPSQKDAAGMGAGIADALTSTASWSPAFRRSQSFMASPDRLKPGLQRLKRKLQQVSAGIAAIPEAAAAQKAIGVGWRGCYKVGRLVPQAPRRAAEFRFHLPSSFISRPFDGGLRTVRSTCVPQTPEEIHAVG